MKNLNNYITERLHITKNTKATPEGFTNKPLELPNNRVEFPVTLEIDRRYKETIIGYEPISRENKILWFKLYDDKYKEVLTLSQKEILLLFDEEKGMMLNTKFGFKPVKLLK